MRPDKDIGNFIVQLNILNYGVITYCPCIYVSFNEFFS